MIPVTIYDLFKQYNNVSREFSVIEKQLKIIPNQFYLKIWWTGSPEWRTIQLEYLYNWNYVT